MLVGGTRRIEQITNMIQSAHRDVVGLVEATDPRVVEELAERLGMDYRMSGYAKHVRDMEIAVLSRLPIVYTHTHRRPGILAQPMLEIGVQEEDGRELTIFVTHLTASFADGSRGGGSIRHAGGCEILGIMGGKQGKANLPMGDFNSLGRRVTLNGR